jgi:sulfoxide reductase catalytic subunit YedY
MLIRKPPDIRSSDITPRHLYLRRREFLEAAGLMATGVAAGLVAGEPTAEAAQGGQPLAIQQRMVTTTDELTSREDVTTYCNFYEFGSDKSDPVRNAGDFNPLPWSVAVEGHCGRPGRYALEDVLKPHALEERVYRMRCVEGWSMVIPWVGFPLADLLARFEPTGRAAFVEFTTVHRPSEMVGQRRRLPRILEWPYVEGLRIDEAMHPLTLVAIGLYGETLLNQNGAPLRLVVPWKYGFKGIKSIVRIRFVEQAPLTSWQRHWPQAYGFYSNVNPEVDHPNHTQSRERRIGEFFQRRTLMFNGYGEQVARLYAGMDLRRHY